MWPPEVVHHNSCLVEITWGYGLLTIYHIPACRWQLWGCYCIVAHTYGAFSTSSTLSSPSCPSYPLYPISTDWPHPMQQSKRESSNLKYNFCVAIVFLNLKTLLQWPRISKSQMHMSCAVWATLVIQVIECSVGLQSVMGSSPTKITLFVVLGFVDLFALYFHTSLMRHEYVIAHTIYTPANNIPTYKF